MSSVTPEEFIKAWQGSISRAEVVEKTGMTYNAVVSRSVLYRKRGVPLKKFSSCPGRPPHDWGALSKLAEELSSDNKETT